MKLPSRVPEGLFRSRSVKSNRGALTGAEGDESGWSQLHLFNKKVNYRCQKNNWWEALNMRDVTAAGDQRRILLQAAAYRCDMFQPSSRRRWWNSSDTPLVPNHCRKYCIVCFQLQERRWGFLKEQQRQQEDIFILRSNDHLKLNRRLVLFLSHWRESLCQSNAQWAQRMNPPGLWGALTHCQDRRCWFQSVHVGQSMLIWRSSTSGQRHRWREATQQSTFIGARLLLCLRTQTHNVSAQTQSTERTTEGAWRSLKEITRWRSKYQNHTVITFNCKWSRYCTGVFFLILSAFDLLLRTCPSPGVQTGRRETSDFRSICQTRMQLPSLPNALKMSWNENLVLLFASWIWSFSLLSPRGDESQDDEASSHWCAGTDSSLSAFDPSPL